MICGDLKILCILLGLQSGYTKFSWFLCLQGNRTRQEHWKRGSWPKREGFEIGERNIIQARCYLLLSISNWG